MIRSRIVLLPVLAGALLVAGCGSSTPTPVSYAAAPVASRPAATSTTAPATTTPTTTTAATTTVPPATTRVAVAAVAPAVVPPAARTTTRPPAPRTTVVRAAAPTTHPPARTATPVARPASNCDPNYSGCVPIDSDVDCAGGSGNGPSYVRGPVRVTGKDIYGLDADKDGIGCE
ncbi:hypothetical protein LWC33_32775 [Pseudonocardia sp. RS11V-5]|uniref:hypothetical protein n=1 Tax=Pseudonocardia terrae TaxID=2905831 RepID=UPI001E2E9FBA|nr:hypothetical protein [Pseudonocardia terrae]MCE3556203.1 hypothetical protein [Pseudonocardia terrae]